MQTESTAEQLKKEFQMTLSKLGHEIRNPIALIVSELQLMASSHPEICTWQGWDSLTDNLDYVRELLNQISDFLHLLIRRSFIKENRNWYFLLYFVCNIIHIGHK